MPHLRHGHVQDHGQGLNDQVPFAILLLRVVFRVLRTRPAVLLPLLHFETSSMRTPLLLPALLTLTTAVAQPTLDPSCAPAAGSSYTFVLADLLNLSGQGAGQVWDATGAFITGNDAVDFVALGSSVAGASFPTADVVQTSAGNETFIDVASDGLYTIGSYNPNLPITSVYTNAYQFLQFPCTLGTTWTDTYGGSYTFSGITYLQTGSGTYEATGYGTLQLPWGNLDNVLRIDGSETYSESGNGNSYVYNSTFSYYYKPGIGIYVARNIDASAELNGVPQGTQQLFLFLDQNSIGINERSAMTIGLEAFPNPAQDQLTLLFTAEGSLSLDVMDGEGRVVLRRSLERSGAGLFREQLDVSGLSAGLYTALVSGTDGQLGMTRFLVQR